MTLILALCGLTMYGLWLYWLERATHVQVTLVVERGDSLGDIATRASQQGIFTWPWLGHTLLRVWGRPVRFGEYNFPAGLSHRMILESLSSGRYQVTHPFTVTEGQTSWQVAEQLNSVEDLYGPPLSPPPEGTVLPETYHFHRGDRRDALLRRMMAAMEGHVRKLWVQRQADSPLRSPEEMVTLASIVEKETAVPEERAKIAGVFLNRLRKNMRLQADPTVIYALTEGREILKRALAKDDLAMQSRYNTYINQGLPPTPIANPGLAALRAVIFPEATDALYFVANGSGGHSFSNTLKNHNIQWAAWRKHQRLKKTRLSRTASRKDSTTGHSREHSKKS